MGTRTYSRRASDGTRKPTALGIRTGKFIAETRAGLDEEGDKLLTKWNRRMRDTVDSTQDIFMEPMKLAIDEDTGEPAWTDRGVVRFGYYADTEMGSQIPEEFRNLYEEIQNNLSTAVVDIVTDIVNNAGIDLLEEDGWGMRIGQMFDDLPTSPAFRIENQDWTIGAYHLPNTRENGRDRERNRVIFSRLSDAHIKVRDSIDYFEELVQNPIIRDNPLYAAIVNTVLKESKRAYNNLLSAEKQAIQPIADDVYAVQYSRSDPFKRENWVTDFDGYDSPYRGIED